MSPRAAAWPLLLAVAAVTAALGPAAAAAATLSGGAASQQGLAAGTADTDAAAGPALKPLPQPLPEDAEGGGDNPHHAAVMAWADRFVQEQAARPARTADQLVPPDTKGESLLERLIGKQEQDSCGVDESKLPVERKHLVVLPAGDSFDASIGWLRLPEKANWDLMVIYYGSQPERFRCPLCAAVYQASGPKWRLAYRFTLLPEWEQYRERYQAIMFPDDDLVMDICTVNTMFSTLAAYDLLMAQPSLCDAAWSSSPWKIVFQNPSNILRFTTFNEIMAPAFNMSFFDNFIRESLYNAYYGWGLDFVWPFLLRYPVDKIAVVDQACVYHPPSLPQKGSSLYAAEAPFRQKEEESRRFAEYGYFDSEINKRGFWYQAAEVLGVVPKPVPKEAFLETSAKVLHTRLGPLYPVLLLGQSAVIGAGCFLILCLRIRGRRREAAFKAENGMQQADSSEVSEQAAAQPTQLPVAAAARAAAAAPASAARQAGPCQRLPFTDEFLHPLEQQKRLEARLTAVQAHSEMQEWLQKLFQTPASELTSTRLADAHRAAEAAKAAAVATAKAAAEAAVAVHAAAAAAKRAAKAAKEEPLQERDGFIDVPAPAPGCGNSSACVRAAAGGLLARCERPGSGFLRLRWPRFAEDARRWAAGPGPNGSCLPRQPGEAVRRDYLLVVPVGNDVSSVLEWLDLPDSATFDVVLLHYGSADPPPACPACAAVLHIAGPKWHLLWQATRLPVWRTLIAGKRAVMVADDDLVMDTCSINRAFEVFSAYGLLLGQPSLCPTAHRPSWYLHLLRDEAAVLRFVSMVEIMAPMFEMEFFQNFVRPSLHDAYTGWGLDFVWPFLLQYPRDRVAVIDDACMTHPHFAQAKKGEGSVYAALAKIVPYDSREEEARRDGQYNYYPSEVQALGFPYRPIEVVGMVPRPPVPPPPPPPPAQEPVAAAEAGPQTEHTTAEAQPVAGQEAAAEAQSTAAQAVAAEAQPAAAQKETADLVAYLKAAGVAQTVVLLEEAADQNQGLQPDAQHATAEQEQPEPATMSEAAASYGATFRAAVEAARQRVPAQQTPLAGGQQVQRAEAVQQADDDMPAAQQQELAAQLVAERTARTSQHQLAAASLPGVDPAAAAAAATPAAQPSVLARPEQLPNALMWTMQHWLLVMQLSVMVGAVVMLAAYSRQRRVGSPRPLPLFSPPTARLLPRSPKP
ncbi:hypothetical protein ABPG75_006217 [Micractinium tetrahymenae]